MKKKHTPGPWQSENDGSCVLSVHGNFNMVASIYGDDPECGRDDRMRANALLIAAAPEMLKELLNIANAEPSKWDGDVRDQFQQWAQNRARIVIAKATGGAE